MSEKKTTSKPGSFGEAFYNRLDALEARGKACGLTLTHICRDSGVARATPDRWRANLPKTVQLIDQMEAVVAKAEKSQAKN